MITDDLHLQSTDRANGEHADKRHGRQKTEHHRPTSATTHHPDGELRQNELQGHGAPLIPRHLQRLLARSPVDSPTLQIRWIPNTKLQRPSYLRSGSIPIDIGPIGR